MNTGSYFTLDVGFSRLRDGIAVYNYTDLQAVDEKPQPGVSRFPISVIITSHSLKFVLHYSTYRYLADGEVRFSSDLPDGQATDIEVLHLEEDLIELPFADDREMTSVVKKLYRTPFPIKLHQDSRASECGELNFILRCLLRRYEQQFSPEDYSYARFDKDFLSYSALSVWDLRDSTGKYVLYSRRESGTVVYNKFLRKLLLDFLFDLKHSDVFKLSGGYDAALKAITTNFFCRSIICKSEFYYQRELVSERARSMIADGKIDDNQKATLRGIYARYFDEAERRWLECIMAPEADLTFIKQQDWYSRRLKKPDTPGKRVHTWFSQEILPHFSSQSVVDKRSWFVGPEEEMRRVTIDLHITGDDGANRNAMPQEQVANSAALADIYHGVERKALSERRQMISQWLFKRYDFSDAFRISFFKCSNLLLVSLLTLLSALLLLWPGFLSCPSWLTPENLGVAKWLVVPMLIFVMWKFYFNYSTWMSQSPPTFRSMAWRATRKGGWMKTLSSLTVILLLFLIPMSGWMRLWLIFGCLIVSFVWGRIHGMPNSVLDAALRYAHFTFPRLVASITAAWFSIAFSVDLFKSFFDTFYSPLSIFLISVVVFVFVLYEVNRSIPLASLWSKTYRTLELMLISFAISVSVGLVVINFTGERLLERSGYLEDFYYSYVLTDEHRSAQTGDFSTDGIGAIDASRHDNQATLMDDIRHHLKHAKRGDAGSRTVAEMWDVGGYPFFVLRDFLIQFSFIAMFIGIFIQMLFHEKNITET